MCGGGGGSGCAGVVAVVVVRLYVCAHVVRLRVRVRVRAHRVLVCRLEVVQNPSKPREEVVLVRYRAGAALHEGLKPVGEVGLPHT